MPALEDIIKGTEITSHYLDKNSQFKIFRCEKNVYAVRYENDKPVDSMHLWHSHKGEQNHNEVKFIGSGFFGEVHAKTKDKVQKSLFKGEHGLEERVKKTNITILQQAFMLKKEGIEQYFVLGLWNSKNKNEVLFNMPRIYESDTVNNQQKMKYLEEFTLAIKKLNEMGYIHPDLANWAGHTSFQNLLLTKDGYKAIDLDSGLLYYPKHFDINKTSRYCYSQDQWIYVYNAKLFQEKLFIHRWHKSVMPWYKKHNKLSLSDSPKELLYYYAQGLIVLPESVVTKLFMPYLNGEIKPAANVINKILTAYGKGTIKLSETVANQLLTLHFNDKKADLSDRILEKIFTSYVKGEMDITEEVAAQLLMLHVGEKQRLPRLVINKILMGYAEDKINLSEKMINLLLTLHLNGTIELSKVLVNKLVLLHHSKRILLAVETINKLHQENAQESVKEYHGGLLLNHSHSFREVSGADFSENTDKKEEYQNITGDALKRAILKELKNSLDDIHHLDTLRQRKQQFWASPEMKILKKAQGEITEKLSRFGLLKTDSYRAAEKIFDKAERTIKSHANA